MVVVGMYPPPPWVGGGGLVLVHGRGLPVYHRGGTPVAGAEPVIIVLCTMITGSGDVIRLSFLCLYAVVLRLRYLILPLGKDAYAGPTRADGHRTWEVQCRVLDTGLVCVLR